MCSINVVYRGMNSRGAMGSLEDISRGPGAMYSLEGIYTAHSTLKA